MCTTFNPYLPSIYLNYNIKVTLTVWKGSAYYSLVILSIDYLCDRYELFLPYVVLTEVNIA